MNNLTKCKKFTTAVPFYQLSWPWNELYRWQIVAGQLALRNCGTVRYGGLGTPADARVKGTVVIQLQPNYSLPFQLSYFCLFGVLRTGVTAHRFCSVMQINMHWMDSSQFGSLSLKSVVCVCAWVAGGFLFNLLGAVFVHLLHQCCCARSCLVLINWVRQWYLSSLFRCLLPRHANVLWSDVVFGPRRNCFCSFSVLRSSFSECGLLLCADILFPWTLYVKEFSWNCFVECSDCVAEINSHSSAGHPA